MKKNYTRPVADTGKTTAKENVGKTNVAGTRCSNFEKTLTNEAAYAVLTEVFNELKERYLDTTDLPNPDVWGEDAQLIRGEEEVAYKMVQISSETDDNIYLVSQLRYLIDKGEMEMVILFDGFELSCYQLDLNEGISVDNIVSVMIECLENVYEQNIE